MSESGLPNVDSLLFKCLALSALITPYLFICVIYMYHFKYRNIMKKIRYNNDKPLYDHMFNWLTPLFRPEGISAVVIYMFFWLGLSIIIPLIDLVPSSIKNLSITCNPIHIILLFIVFDCLMYSIHYCQHNWRWLYINTHSIHHTITSPTILVALTGYWKDTFLLILIPLHLTVYISSIFNFANFIETFIFSLIALFHLHCIHSEFKHPWDNILSKFGIVNTNDHHVHHLRPRYPFIISYIISYINTIIYIIIDNIFRKNLAHFFVIIDKIFGTYQHSSEFPRINR